MAFLLRLSNIPNTLFLVGNYFLSAITEHFDALNHAQCWLVRLVIFVRI